MKKTDFNQIELRANDFASGIREFYTNAKSVGDCLINIKLTLVALVCCAGLMARVRVKYLYNYTLSMILLNLLCIAPTGKGKTAINFIFNTLMKLFVEMTEKERAIMNNYKRNNPPGTKRKDKEPNVAIRLLQKFTLPIAVKYADMIRLKYGDILPFFLYADELGSFIENKKGNAEFSAVARTAYNLGEKYTRDTLYEGGYNGSVDITWNSIICCQLTSLAKYITKEGLQLGDGSRHIPIEIGTVLGEEPPSVRPFTKEQELRINDVVNRLMAATYTPDGKLQPIHEVDMSWLFKDVKTWCDQQRDLISKSGSKALDSFYGRASESAFRIATIDYYLFGEDPAKQKNVRRVYYFFAKFILDSLMSQWGQQFEAGAPKDRESTVTRPTLYDSLPKRFTRKQLCEKIVELGISTAPRKFIYKWTQKKWVFEIEGQSDTFEKIYE